MKTDNIVSAATFLFAPNDDGVWCVLCGRRSGHDPRYKGGLFDVPCGMREDDEDIVNTALRETYEEAGIHLSGGDIKFIEKQPWGNGKIGSNFLGIFDECLPIGSGDFEHDFFKWLPVGDVGKYKWVYGMDSKVLDLFDRFVNKEEKFVNEVFKRVIMKILG